MAIQIKRKFIEDQAVDSSKVDSSIALSADLAAEEARALAAEGVLQDNIDVEKGRIDAILLAADADKDSFAEIVTLINSIDATNDSAFAGYVLSNDAALAQEVADRIADVDAEQARAEAAEGQIASDLLTEVARATSAEVGLQGQIDSEVQARILGDQNEAEARIAADALKVDKAGDTMTGTLVVTVAPDFSHEITYAASQIINTPGDGFDYVGRLDQQSAHVYKTDNNGEFLGAKIGSGYLDVYSETAADGLVSNIYASTDVTGAAQLYVQDLALNNISTIDAGQISLLTDNVASMPSLDEHVATKAYVDQEIVAAGGDISAVANDVANLVTLSGVAVDSVNLGSFSGATIADNQTIKQALQALETAHEAEESARVAADALKVDKAGDTMSGNLVVNDVMGTGSSTISSGSVSVVNDSGGTAALVSWPGNPGLSIQDTSTDSNVSLLGQGLSIRNQANYVIADNARVSMYTLDVNNDPVAVAPTQPYHAANKAYVDQEISAANGDISALQTKVDNIQTGAGLDVDGDYVAPLGTNYLGGSTTLANADSLLDAAIKAEETARIADVDAEESRALAAEGVLQANITAEESARIAADADLQSQINNVLSNVDPAALDSLTEVVAAFQAADANLNNAITNLSTSLQDDVDNLVALSGVAIDSVNLGTFDGTTILDNQTIKQALQGLETAHEGEVTARISADSAEQAARIAEDLTFIKMDGTRAMSGDLNLGGNGIVSGSWLDIDSAKLNLEVSTFAAVYVDAGEKGLEIGQPSGGAMWDTRADGYSQLTLNGKIAQIDSSKTGGASHVIQLNAETNIISIQGSAGTVVNFANNVGDATVLKKVANPVASDDAANKDYVDAAILAAGGDISAVANDVANLVTLSGVAVDSVNLGAFTGTTIADDQTIKQALQALETAHEAEETRALAAESALDGRVSALEADHYLFNQQGFVLNATDISNGYIDLAHEVVSASLNMYVDRLAIHETDDYTVSVVGGVTRITFAGSLMAAGEEALVAGDVIKAKYAYRV